MDPEIVKTMRSDPFGGRLGIELVEVEEGRALARMTVEDSHRNFLGTVHGGAIFALADVAFGAAANSRGTRCMAFHISIEFLDAPGDTPYLEAEVHEDGRAGRAGHFRMQVRDSGSRVIAILDGWAYQTGRPLAG